jgi:AraC family transcriptional activator FtrA
MLNGYFGCSGSYQGYGVRHVNSHEKAIVARWGSVAPLAGLPYIDQILPSAKKRPKVFNRRVAAFAYNGLCAFEFSCAAEVFGLSRPELEPGWYRFRTYSATGRAVRGQFGIRMAVDGGLAQLVKAGTIIIPGWAGIHVPIPANLIDALREAHANGARLLSICSGVFVLAATGLLDGKQATTHWQYAAEVQRRYPRIRVNPNVLYVDEGQVLTSAGSAAGLDLCLHLVRRDFGAGIANQVARRLVIPPHRDGGQAQFVERPVEHRKFESSRSRSIAALTERIRRYMHGPLRIHELVRFAAMSERTFMRRFRKATGHSPADWITRARLDRAKEFLERTTLSMESIAIRCGLGTASTLRHHFRKKLGVTPLAYRKRFSQTSRPMKPI